MKNAGLSLMIIGFILAIIIMFCTFTVVDTDAEYDEREGAEIICEILGAVTVPTILFGGFLFVGGCVLDGKERSSDGSFIINGKPSETVAGATNNLCPNCNKPCSEDEKFCAACGQFLK